MPYNPKRSRVVNENFVRQQLPLLDRGLDKGEVPVNLVVYRGERYGFADRFLKAYHSGKLAEAKEKGQLLTYRNYLSTTITLDNFASGHFDSHKVRLVIKVPKGTKAGYLSTVAWESERELLLPRCSRLKIDDFGMDQEGRLNVECTYLPPRKDLPPMTGKEFEAYLNTKAASRKSTTKTRGSDNSKKVGKGYNGSSQATANKNKQKGPGGK